MSRVLCAVAEASMVSLPAVTKCASWAEGGLKFQTNAGVDTGGRRQVRCEGAPFGGTGGREASLRRAAGHQNSGQVPFGVTASAPWFKAREEEGCCKAG